MFDYENMSIEKINKLEQYFLTQKANLRGTAKENEKQLDKYLECLEEIHIYKRTKNANLYSK